MQKIPLLRIMQAHDMNKKVIAKSLFPKNAYPVLALNRVLAGKSLLDSDQISRLSFMTGRPISALFGGGDWTFTYAKPDYTFNSGDFIAQFHASTGIIKVWDKHSLFHEEVLNVQDNLLLVPLLEKLSGIRDEYIKLR